MLMSDAGGSDDLNGVNLTFSDSASGALPDVLLLHREHIAQLTTRLAIPSLHPPPLVPIVPHCQR